jgi:hypothetical protein
MFLIGAVSLSTTPNRHLTPKPVSLPILFLQPIHPEDKIISIESHNFTGRELEHPGKKSGGLLPI